MLLPPSEFSGLFFSAVGQADHQDADCFVLIILSHGAEDGVYGIDGVINPDELIEPIKGDNCPGLIGKPKLIFIEVTNRLSSDVISVMFHITQSTTPIICSEQTKTVID